VIPPAEKLRAAPATPRLLDALDRDLDPARLDGAVPAGLWRRALTDPLCELAGRPGKELRARLVEAAWWLAGGTGAAPPALALVVEGLHTGSLIVDDVQDQAEQRRGGPALHHLCGVPLAINAGNWLYFWALAQLEAVSAAPAVIAAMYRATVSTLVACHQGQALDLSVRAHEVERARVPAVVAAITRGKTAALLGLGPRLAALAAGAPPARVEVLGQLGEQLGTALQMLDDLGGLGPARRDKGLEDLRAARATWPWAWLAETIDELGFARLQQRTRLAGERGDDGELVAVADTIRIHVDELGRTRAHRCLDHALARARAELGDSPALDALAAQARRLQESYV